MHEIKMPNDSSSDCFDSIAYSMLKYHDYDYEAYNIKYFYTDYYCSSDNCIIRGEERNDILKYIYNVDVISKDKDASLNLSKKITDLTDKVPIGIFIDLYYCPWSPFFNRTYFTHCLLIVDVDDENKKYLCFDVYFNKIGYVEVDMDIIHEHYESYFIFDFEKATQVKIELLLGRINDSIRNFDSDTSNKALKMYNFFTSNDKNILFPGDLDTSIHLVNLTWIVEDKKHFSIALRYIEKRLGVVVFTPIYELLSDSEKMFSILTSILIKYNLTGVLKEEKLKGIINQIYLTDDLIINQMKTILRRIDFN